MDHGEEVYEETKRTLRDAGIVYSNSTELGVYETKGIQIAMLSYLCIDRYDELWDRVPAEIAAAKERYPLVIVSFHWGKEPTSSNPQQGYIPTDNQIRLGRMAVDAGADLVVGTHSHRIQPIECYNNKYILYSLGNFCFAGNSKPRDMSSIIFQIRYRVKNGEVSFRDFRVIPIRISSVKERNDLVPWIFPDGYDRDSVLLTLKGNTENDSRLSWGVTDYPLEFQ
jgi:poly-gamma-glutamate synthesis protein (capsule biosynthesis protein)